jgi:hypothetical protein
MPSDVKADLIYALLAMDSYSRGYGAGIRNFLDVGSLASWSILTTSEAEYGQTAFNAGFYAIAYRNATTGETVISYRGTDKNFSFLPDGEGSDLVNGYGIAVGVTDAPQGVLAERFFHDVSASAQGIVTLTGHSLGGGLAGYVSSITNTKSVLFDNMPFGIAATLRAQQLGGAAFISGARSYFVEGEILADARSGDLQRSIGDGLAALPANESWRQLGNDIGALTVRFEQPIDRNPAFSLHTSEFGQLQRHSLALLSVLLWNQGYGDVTWTPMARQLWTAFFDPAVLVNGGNPQITALQGRLAEDFYNAVAGTAGSSTIRVTGHSLGEGLAGYVGTVSGRDNTHVDVFVATAGNDNGRGRVAA